MHRDKLTNKTIRNNREFSKERYKITLRNRWDKAAIPLKTQYNMSQVRKIIVAGNGRSVIRANDEKAYGCCGRWNPPRSLNVRLRRAHNRQWRFPSHFILGQMIVSLVWRPRLRPPVIMNFWFRRLTAVPGQRSKGGRGRTSTKSS